MAFDHHSLKTGPLPLRAETGRLISPDGVGGRIVNMELTEAGTLRSIVGPVEYHPAAWEDNGGSVPAATAYAAPLRGVFHCLLGGGERDVLLVHRDNGIFAHEGWGPGWQAVLADLSLAEFQTKLPEDDGRPNFLTQFEATPNGVVIVPQGGRAYFYDGTTAAPLGFDKAPGAPSPLGPTSSSANDGGTLTDSANDEGYTHSGRNLAQQMGVSRLGTLRGGVIDVQVTAAKKSNSLGGILEEGEWRLANQFLDPWGNLSPLSERSAPIRLSKEDNLTKDRKKDLDERQDRMRVQGCWTDIDTGPSHCVGRLLSRTLDLQNAGDNKLYWLTPNSTSSALTAATIPDNASSIFPDNIPDSWLLAEAKDPVAVPLFKLCKVAFGRLWIANMAGAPGLLRPSEPGFWGTFPRNEEIYPDPQGAEITGLWTVAQGLLVFTTSSTFIITQAGDATGKISFEAATLNPFVGCVSPDSIKTLPSGLTVWLGREGFYSWNGERIQLISQDIKDNVIQRINRVRSKQACAAVSSKMGVYRCWVPVDGSSENNLGLEYDGTGWREMDYINVAAVCTTRDHRDYMLALGQVNTTQTPTGHSSLWLLDHAGGGNQTPIVPTSTVETGWLKNTRSKRRSTLEKAFVWIRETNSGTLDVAVMRDWREYPLVNQGAAQGPPPTLHPDDDIPPFWDDAILNGTYVNKMVDATLTRHFVKRRPNWLKIPLYVPSAETFKIRLTFQGDFDFIAIQFEDKDKDGGGIQVPEGVQ